MNWLPPGPNSQNLPGRWRPLRTSCSPSSAILLPSKKCYGATAARWARSSAAAFMLTPAPSPPGWLAESPPLVPSAACVSSTRPSPAGVGGPKKGEPGFLLGGGEENRMGKGRGGEEGGTPGG